MLLRGSELLLNVPTGVVQCSLLNDKKARNSGGGLCLGRAGPFLKTQ